MSWEGWKDGNKVFPGHNVNIKIEGEWIHYLVTPLDEPDPDHNHIHIKERLINKGGKATVEYSLVGDAYLVAAVRVDGKRVINRRKLIEAINQHTGLNLLHK